MTVEVEPTKRRHPQRKKCQEGDHEFGHLRGRQTKCMWCQTEPLT